MWRVVFTEQAAKGATRLKTTGLERKTKRLIQVVWADQFGTPSAFEALSVA